MAVGSGASLPQALQHATMELHHWLDDDFGLNERSVSILVGQALEYEIANLAGPDVTVVAKMRKVLLAARRLGALNRRRPCRHVLPAGAQVVRAVLEAVRRPQLDARLGAKERPLPTAASRRTRRRCSHPER